MRARAVLAAMVVLGACTGGDSGGFRPAPTSSSTVTTVTTVTTATAVAPATTTSTAPLAGAVTLRVTGLTLPETGAGLRLVVRSASPRLQVGRRGGSGVVTVCPADAGACVPVPAEVPAGTGIELRASGGQRASAEEVTVTYVPAARTTTIVTPARPAGACAPAPCEATYSFTPGGAGAFALDGRAAGGRSRLVLTAVGPSRPPSGQPGPGSNRTVATVEGGAVLSIRGTLEAGSEARLLHHELTEDPVAPLTAEISWP